MLARDGVRATFGRTLRWIGASVAGENREWLVAPEDAARTDWTEKPDNLRHPVVVRSGPVEIAWISSVPGEESGGHHNLFRFIKFAEEAGHRSTIYLYDQSNRNLRGLQSMLRSSSAYPDLDARIVPYDPAVGVEPQTQAIFATGWETAYPAYLDRSSARRFYFVQDFEPSFYAVGAEYVLAENTYRFGFHGITAGRWLARRLHDEYGMTTDSFDFAVERSRYHVLADAPRSELFFYARPATARRAFQLGLLALTDFHAIRPDVTINLAGGTLAGWHVPFPHRNHAAVDVGRLNELYNRCAAGLVLSLTNMSLLPMELMSSGVVPVVNDAPNNREVFDSPYIEWSEPSPPALARSLIRAVEHPDPAARARAMSESLADSDWAASGRQFVAAFERGMRG